MKTVVIINFFLDKNNLTFKGRATAINLSNVNTTTSQALTDGKKKETNMSNLQVKTDTAEKEIPTILR